MSKREIEDKLNNLTSARKARKKEPQILEQERVEAKQKLIDYLAQHEELSLAENIKNGTKTFNPTRGLDRAGTTLFENIVKIDPLAFDRIFLDPVFSSKSYASTSRILAEKLTMNSLKSLSISGNRSKTLLADVNNILRNNSEIKEFSWSGSGIFYLIRIELINFLEGLGKCIDLESLRLPSPGYRGDNSLEDLMQGTQDLASALKKLPVLQLLDLSVASLKFSKISFIDVTPNLQTLSLGSLRMDISSFKELLSNLKLLPSLKFLDISDIVIVAHPPADEEFNINPGQFMSLRFLVARKVASENIGWITDNAPLLNTLKTDNFGCSGSQKLDPIIRRIKDYKNITSLEIGTDFKSSNTIEHELNQLIISKEHYSIIKTSLRILTPGRGVPIKLIEQHHHRNQKLFSGVKKFINQFIDEYSKNVEKYDKNPQHILSSLDVSNYKYFIGTGLVSQSYLADTIEEACRTKLKISSESLLRKMQQIKDPNIFTITGICKELMIYRKVDQHSKTLESNHNNKDTSDNIFNIPKFVIAQISTFLEDSELFNLAFSTHENFNSSCSGSASLPPLDHG